MTWGVEEGLVGIASPVDTAGGCDGVDCGVEMTEGGPGVEEEGGSLGVKGVGLGRTTEVVAPAPRPTGYSDRWMDCIPWPSTRQRELTEFCSDQWHGALIKVECCHIFNDLKHGCLLWGVDPVAIGSVSFPQVQVLHKNALSAPIGLKNTEYVTLLNFNGRL